MFELNCGEPQRSDVTTASKRRGGEWGLCEDWTEREILGGISATFSPIS